VAFGTVLLVLAALAVAAAIQSRHDEHASSDALVAAWRSVGSSLVRPSLAAEADAAGLECLVYRVTPAPDGVALCVDDAGRLVEAIRQTGSGVSLTSVATDPSRAPLRFSPASLAVAAKVVALNTAADQIEESLALCDRAVTVAHRRFAKERPSTRTTRRLLRLMSEGCAQTAGTIRSSAPNEIETRAGKRLVLRLEKASTELSNLASSMTGADGRPLEIRAQLRGALRLRLLTRVTKDRFTRQLVQERRRLTGNRR
jgi:hypothetical protein